MLNNPRLAKCTDRSALAKVNPKYGEPTEWFDALSTYNFCGISFDFFVNWKDNNTTTNEVWYKLSVEKSKLNLDTISKEIIDSISQEQLTKYLNFAHVNGLKFLILIIPDDQDFSNDESEVYFIKFNLDLSSEVKAVKISELKSKIRQNSGGAVSMGNKGLIYGTSCLECYLSNTDSLYPGDIDLLVFEDIEFKPKVIFEFKKHNLQTDLNEQTLSKYYPHPDGRKYNRLNIFRDLFFPNIPIIVVYYSTDVKYDYILLEYIDKRDGQLKSLKRATLKFDQLSTTNMIHRIINWYLSE